MALTPLKLNNISITIDGGTNISRDDITSVTFGSVNEAPNVEKTFGGAFHTISTSGEKEFSITVKGNSEAQRILSTLFNEFQSDPQYHSYTFFDGGITTLKYENALLKDVNSKYEIDSSVQYEYSFSALKLKMENGNV